jgi:hypothetical protein
MEAGLKNGLRVSKRAKTHMAKVKLKRLETKQIFSVVEACSLSMGVVLFP